MLQSVDLMTHDGGTSGLAGVCGLLGTFVDLNADGTLIVRVGGEHLRFLRRGTALRERDQSESQPHDASNCKQRAAIAATDLTRHGAVALHDLTAHEKRRRATEAR